MNTNSIEDEDKHNAVIYELINAIKKSQTIEYDKIRNLEFEQMKAMNELQFCKSEKTMKCNFEHVKCLELLQHTEADVYFKNMIKNVKETILETRQNDYNLTQEHFNLSKKKTFFIC